MPGARLGELVDMQFVQHCRHLVVDILRAVVRMETENGERQGDEHLFQNGKQTCLGYLRHRADMLELGDLVHQIDDMDAFLAVPVALVDGVDADKAGPATGLRALAYTDVHRDRLGVMP